SFDANGNLRQYRDFCGQDNCCDPQDASCRQGPLSASFDYDALDRLTKMKTGAGGSEQYAYGYDPLNNMTLHQGADQEEGGQGRGPEGLVSARGRTYEQDANGNVKRAGDLELAWNTENMVEQARRDGQTLYQKSFLGESMWKKVVGTGQSQKTIYYLPAM